MAYHATVKIDLSGFSYETKLEGETINELISQWKTIRDNDGIGSRDLIETIYVSDGTRGIIGSIEYNGKFFTRQ